MNKITTSTLKTHSQVLSLVIDGLFIALTFIFTAFINVRLPIAANGGLIHLGNIPLFLAAILFGKRSGALAGAFGMALFDITSGWAIWAPFTFLIVGLMGYVVGLLAEKKQGLQWYGLAFLLATLIKVIGYYIAEGILYGNWLTPISSIPGNIIQVGLASIVVLLLIMPLKKVSNRIFM